MKKLIALCLCLLWMGVIFYNSSDNGKATQEKSRYLVDVIKIKYEGLQVFNNKYNSKNNEIINSTERNTSWDEKFNKILRKNAHVFEYLLLAVVISALLFSFNLKGRNAIIYIMFICLFYAVTDEFHQRFVPGRSSLVSDVLIDFLGSIVGISVYYLFYYTLYEKIRIKT